MERCRSIWKNRAHDGELPYICNFMSSIGKMFGDAGLRDVAVESGVIAEGSINRVLEGKQYNRAVRLHKLMYEALMRIIWKGFRVWIESNHPDKGPQIRSTDLKIRSIKEDVATRLSLLLSMMIHVYEL
ncbi:hypothetical protein GWK47_018839 [Chionoecetes opilio]|uniref:Uncharacterized protein n=1 Tax=Chionoecetes opilio TaxID=41210 RepID=A0A8J4XR95_CHIOP|nr:hypothetical protein GWK47_018839 [Chionoecetes opilio]